MPPTHVEVGVSLPLLAHLGSRAPPLWWRNVTGGGEVVLQAPSTISFLLMFPGSAVFFGGTSTTAIRICHDGKGGEKCHFLQDHYFFPLIIQAIVWGLKPNFFTATSSPEPQWAPKCIWGHHLCPPHRQMFWCVDLSVYLCIEQGILHSFLDVWLINLRGETKESPHFHDVDVTSLSFIKWRKKKKIPTTFMTRL